LSLGGNVYDPSDPMGKCFFNILATFAEFEVDLLRMRTREGTAVASAKGRLKGRRPSSARPSGRSCSSSTELANIRLLSWASCSSIGCATVYREIARKHARKPVAAVR
jgi:DNA invertase Pin-like site-specific DNA recombinase